MFENLNYNEYIAEMNQPELSKTDLATSELVSPFVDSKICELMGISISEML